MFDAPIEDWYVWLGVATVSVAVLGVAVGLPTAAPPEASAVADTVDRVAASPTGSMATVNVRASTVRIDRARIGLSGEGGTTHAAIAFGPMTPASTDVRLERVAAGDHPRDVFDSPSAFADAAATARNRSTSWRPAPETLTVRRVSWEGVDVLLVG